MFDCYIRLPKGATHQPEFSTVIANYLLKLPVGSINTQQLPHDWLPCFWLPFVFSNGGLTMAFGPQTNSQLLETAFGAIPITRLRLCRHTRGVGLLIRCL